MKKPLIVIAGPTASGKTSLSVALAHKINGEIISVDSMQVYKGMDIGTAKVRIDETKGIKHHLIDICKPDEPFNIHIFQKKAKEAIEDILKRGKIPILVGGTGFYIQSIVYDIQFEDTNDDDGYRSYLESVVQEKGTEYLHNMLKKVDPDSSVTIHPNNVKRVIRALEFYHQTGTCISKHNIEQEEKESPYNLLFYVLNMDRHTLYKRIDNRVDQMFEEGLVEEVKRLYALGYTQNLVSMQGLGYKEILRFIDGEYDLETANYIIKRDTRHFAKRQLTWFRREKDVKWLEVDKYGFDTEKILSKIIKDIEVIGIL